MLTSNPGNIRYNGTGRTFVGDVDGASLMDFGELENFQFSVSTSKETMKSNRTADRSIILERETERTAQLSWGARELTKEIAALALMGSAIGSANQPAGFKDAEETALAADQHVDLGVVDVFVTRITGVITGALVAGTVVTGDISEATGKIAWTEEGLVELVNVVGTFQADEKVSVDVTNYITASGIEVSEDAVVANAAIPTIRYDAGVDYDLDADYGLLRMREDGAIVSPAFVSFDYPARSVSVFHAMEAGSVVKKVVFVSDGADGGPRYRITFWKVSIVMSGDWSLIGDGASILPFSCTVLKDTNRPAGQQFFKVEKIS